MAIIFPSKVIKHCGTERRDVFFTWQSLPQLENLFIVSVDLLCVPVVVL